jgi:hypothetical protein
VSRGVSQSKVSLSYREVRWERTKLRKCSVSTDSDMTNGDEHADTVHTYVPRPSTSRMHPIADVLQVKRVAEIGTGGLASGESSELSELASEAEEEEETTAVHSKKRAIEDGANMSEKREGKKRAVELEDQPAQATLDGESLRSATGTDS